MSCRPAHAEAETKRHRVDRRRLAGSRHAGHEGPRGGGGGNAADQSAPGTVRGAMARPGYASSARGPASKRMCRILSAGKRSARRGQRLHPGVCAAAIPIGPYIGRLMGDLILVQAKMPLFPILHASRPPPIPSSSNETPTMKFPNFRGVIPALTTPNTRTCRSTSTVRRRPGRPAWSRTASTACWSTALHRRKLVADHR